MVSYTILFLSSARATSFVFQNLHFFHDYVPILYRYDSVHTAKGHLGDVRSLFAIDLFNAILQCVVLIVLGLMLYRQIRGRRPDRLDLKKNLLFVALLLFMAVPSLDVFFGLPDDTLFSGVFMAAATVPVFNALLYFIIYARFWESYYEDAWLGRRTAPPIENSIRQTDSER